ncbi:hypothetical protein GLP59_15180 [Sulfitobacter sp. M220]|uniref:hypothetical protein n=1 Tax=Sulfitobacter sp. M220 TaxID=2675333 RepID=UPI001F289E77|nr:hypothetical protein [Sulfitobacter sp. M220]MCF7778971.1 hypothetical protein [Sulfitobacter sp. M220]
MKNFLLLIAASALSSCTAMPKIAPADDGAPTVNLADATKVDLWATRYFTFLADPTSSGNSVPLRNMNDSIIGPSLSSRDWCLAALEGSLTISGRTYNYAGTADPRQADCAFHRPTERVRWERTQFEFGVGNRNNPLVPYRTIACDQGVVRDSTPWINGGYATFGQEIYIPRAVGVSLPDGTTHDGIFTCGDIGGLITGNHIDVFIGPARGESDASQIDPFDFTKGAREATFEAYVLR